MDALALRQALRRALQQVTLSGEDASASVDPEELADSAFYDPDLDAELLAAAVHLANVCDADHLGTLDASRHPDALFDAPYPLRVLGSRITAPNGKAAGSPHYASRMGRMALMARRNRYTVGDTDDPVYVAQDGAVSVYAGAGLNGLNPTGVAVGVVALPTASDALPAKLQPSQILFAAAECWTQLGMIDRAHAATAEYIQTVKPYLRFEQDPIVNTLPS